MSRKPRFVLPGVPQHVIQRGRNREPRFFANDDYHRYLQDLREATIKNGLQLHAYVLMTKTGVGTRGHNREPCFFANDDYHRYLHDLRDAAIKNGLRIHAYVLMTNHVHLLATPQQTFSVMHTMQDLGRKYVRYVNQTYKRTGGLWEGRYKASLVDSEKPGSEHNKR